MTLINKINKFYERHLLYKKPLEKIINNMLEECKYINNESLERHNWGDKPIKIENIPDCTDNNFESQLNNILGIPNIELLWGDIQLGKRIHACIIMWFSIHILGIPVLYIFRNLKIDKDQLKTDIANKNENDFNYKYIKKYFEEYENELDEDDYNHISDYYLPDLIETNNDILNKFNNKNGLTKSIYCCLMNNNNLDKINIKFNEYIAKEKEKVNIIILVDESDLMCPTSSNDGSCKNDFKDTTQCERILSKIYNKIRYVLHITGTAHSLLYNVTTLFNNDDFVNLKISKVHKMKRKNDYYGLFNNKIYFDTEKINKWWKNSKYNLKTDYENNIKKIINIIIERKNYNYSSLLISEEKIKVKQFDLLEYIIKDFKNIFIIIFHGKCLELYLSKEYLNSILECNNNNNIKILDKDNYKKYENDDNYINFKIDYKNFNIKQIYKLLRKLFIDKSDLIKNKVVITITGKYGERGYSFTSDDYDKYSFHLTDQYLLSHSTFNCTNISQRLRLQGKYNDDDLINNKIKLILWTTEELEDVIINFFIKFMNEIEKNIMNKNSWEEIKELIENISGFDFYKYKKYLDVTKKIKNVKNINYFDKEMNAYSIPFEINNKNINDSDKKNINDICKKYNLPEFNEFINNFEEINNDEFINKFGKKKTIHDFEIIDKKKINSVLIKDFIDRINIKYKLNLKNELKHEWYDNRNKYKDNDLYKDYVYNNNKYEWKKRKIEDYAKSYLYLYKSQEDDYNKNKRVLNLCYDNNNKLNIYIRILDKHKELPKNSKDYIKEKPYIKNDNIIIYSYIKEIYKENIPDTYYYQTVDNKIFFGGNDSKLFDNNFKSLDILSRNTENNDSENNDSENNDSENNNSENNDS
jgi:hypothetical protein